MLQRRHIVPESGVGDGAVIIPPGRMIADAGKHVQRFPEMAALDIIPRRVHVHRIFVVSRTVLRSPVALSAEAEAAEEISKIAEAAEISSVITAVGASAIGTSSVGAVSIGAAAVRTASGRSPLAFVHDLLIRLLDLLEFFLRLIFIGIVHIGVRVIFPAQRAVGLFDLLVRRVPGHAQRLIWVTHFPAFPFSGHARSQTGTTRRNKGYCAECPYFPESGAFQKPWSIRPSSF